MSEPPESKLAANRDGGRDALARREVLPVMGIPAYEPIFRVFVAIPAEAELPALEIATALARGLAAQIEGRVLLLDAQFDAPPGGVKSSAAGERGLSELLVQREAWQERYATALDGGLFLLPRGGAAAPGPAQVRGRLGALLGELSSHYSLVVIVCDPVADSVLSRVIAAFGEKTLLLAREDQTAMLALSRSRDLLVDNLVEHIEVVLDKPPVSWLQRLYTPPWQLISAVAVAAWQGLRSLVRMVAKPKADREPAPAFSLPRRPPAQETNEGA